MPQALSATLALSLLLATTAHASGPKFLPVADAVKAVADGKPWTGNRAGRETVRITINADKTFVFEGPITISDEWSLRGEALCLHMGLLLGDKCLRFEPIDKGFQAYEDGTPAFTLTRP